MKRLFLFLVVVFLCSGCKNGGGEPKKDSVIRVLGAGLCSILMGTRLGK